MNYISDAGLRILQTLDKMGRSQNWLAMKVNAHRHTISRFIYGYNDLRLSTAIRIADALGVSLDWLYLGR